MKAKLQSEPGGGCDVEAVEATKCVGGRVKVGLEWLSDLCEFVQCVLPTLLIRACRGRVMTISRRIIRINQRFVKFTWGKKVEVTTDNKEKADGVGLDIVGVGCNHIAYCFGLVMRESMVMYVPVFPAELPLLERDSESTPRNWFVDRKNFVVWGGPIRDQSQN